LQGFRRPECTADRLLKIVVSPVPSPGSPSETAEPGSGWVVEGSVVPAGTLGIFEANMQPPRCIEPVALVGLAAGASCTFYVGDISIPRLDRSQAS
jgi:hypothetical protein